MDTTSPVQCAPTSPAQRVEARIAMASPPQLWEGEGIAAVMGQLIGSTYTRVVPGGTTGPDQWTEVWDVTKPSLLLRDHVLRQLSPNTPTPLPDPGQRKRATMTFTYDGAPPTAVPDVGVDFVLYNAVEGGSPIDDAPVGRLRRVVQAHGTTDYWQLFPTYQRPEVHIVETHVRRIPSAPFPVAVPNSEFVVVSYQWM